MRTFLEDARKALTKTGGVNPGDSDPILLCVERGEVHGVGDGGWPKTTCRAAESPASPWPGLVVSAVGWASGMEDPAEPPPSPLSEMRRILGERCGALLALVPDPRRLREVRAALDIVYPGFGDDDPRRCDEDPPVPCGSSLVCSVEYDEIVATREGTHTFRASGQSNPPIRIGEEAAAALDRNGSEWRRGTTRLIVSLVERVPNGASAHEVVDLLERIRG